MLRVSAQTTSTEIDIRGINGDALAAASGIAFGLELMEFAGERGRARRGPGTRGIAPGRRRRSARRRRGVRGQLSTHGEHCRYDGNPDRQPGQPARCRGQTATRSRALPPRGPFAAEVSAAPHERAARDSAMRAGTNALMPQAEALSHRSSSRVRQSTIQGKAHKQTQIGRAHV